MDQLTKDLEKLFKKHNIKRILASKPRNCPPGTKPVQIIVNGKKIWVCR